MDMRMTPVLRAAWAGALAVVIGLSSATVFAAEDEFTYHVVHHFTKKSDGKNHPRYALHGVIVATDGGLYGVSVYGGHRDEGTTFRIAPATGDATVLHSFHKTGQDGQYPTSQLMELEDGHFLGAATGGGQFGAGMIFRMHAQGHIQPVHEFAGGPSDGAYPGAPPVLATDGWRYGVTSGGGQRDHGTIYRLGPAGEFELLYSFQGHHRGDGESPIGPLVQAPDGLFYGVTREGGENGRGVLYRIDAQGHYERLHDFNNGLGGAKPSAALMLASDGRLYGSTAYGGTHGWGTVFRVGASGRPEPLYAVDPDHDGLRVAGRLTEAGDGRLYFMLAWGAGAEATRNAPLMRLDRETGIAEVVGRIPPDRIGTEVYGPLAVGPDGSFFGTTLLPDGGVVFRFSRN